MDPCPEWNLLLASARANPTAERLRTIARLARADLGWDQIAMVSYAHGIAPLIYHSLHLAGVIKLLPSGAAEALYRAYHGNAARNLLLYDELRRVLMALKEQRIEVIALKGAALAEAAYGHKALRPMSDIDLLVRKEKLTEVEAKLLDLGYLIEESEKTREYYQKHHYHFVFKNQSATSIEIHWHIKRPTDPFRVDIDGLWERAQPVKIAGIDALVFSLEDLLLHLCQHLWKHKLTGGIRPLCDIAGVTTHYRDKIDWSKMAKTSSEWEMNSCSYLGLWLARELLDAPIPESFLKDLKPVNFNTEFIGWARERLLANGESSPVFPDLLQLFWKGRSFRERWAVLQKILSPKKVVGYSRSSPASKTTHLYYLRIKHLLTRYGPTVCRLVAGDQKIRATAEKEENQLRLTKWLSSGYQ